jgi:hypothetical protein
MRIPCKRCEKPIEPDEQMVAVILGHLGALQMAGTLLAPHGWHVDCGLGIADHSSASSSQVKQT